MIKIENTLKTSVTYNGTGTQTRFDFPFDYLRKSFVYVSVDNTLLDNTTDYTIDGRTVVFNTAPASGSVIRIYRETATDRLVVWADASVLKAADMTIQQVQQLHILEEANDWTKSSSIVLNDDGTAWQGRNYRLTNIADPVDEQDAVTKGYMETVQSGFVTENTKIKDEATRQVGLAKDEKLKAQQYAEAASDSKDLAKRWAEATDSPDYTTSKSAKTWAEEAKDARDEAKDTAVNLGNPVSDVTENNGTVTVTKSNGTQSTFMAFPQDANGTLPIAKGGTGATSAAAARTNLGIDTTYFNPTGSIIAFAGNTLPDGYLLCDGSQVSRTTYKKLFDVIGITYSEGDGSATFNLPNLTDKFIQGSNTVGTVKNAGLPNITGTLSTYNGEILSLFNHVTGCFTRDNPKDSSLSYDDLPENTSQYAADYCRGGIFDASKSNAIYGNSTTVQPPAVTMRYIIKY